MEYVVVRYWRRRTVYINGNPGGFTNLRLSVNRGTHTFDLGDPRNYRPRQRRIRVINTTRNNPRELHFEHV